MIAPIARILDAYPRGRGVHAFCAEQAFIGYHHAEEGALRIAMQEYELSDQAQIPDHRVAICA